MAKKVLIAGGTGFLGTSIIRKLQAHGFHVFVLTRGETGEKNGFTFINWNVNSSGVWTKELENTDAVINLCGRSVNCRYTRENKKQIIESRVDATYAIGQAIANAASPPGIWINAGSAAIFGDSGNEIKTEASDVGAGFPAQVCKEWEAAFDNCSTPGTRKVLLRIGLVFQRKIGLLQPFVKLTKAGFGGRFGGGEQYISWIHEDDFTQLVLEVIENKDYSGVIHAASPQPVSNRNFFKHLRKVLNVPVGLPLPALLLHIGGKVAGTEASLLLSGRRVVSKVLGERKFTFSYPEISKALAHLLERKNY